MILEEVMNKLIRNSIDLIVGQQGYTIKSNQVGAPRPKGTYADVNFVSEISLGWEQFKYEDDIEEKVKITSKGSREVMMSLGFYRLGSADNARLVRQGLVRESVQSLFRSVGVALIRRSEIRDVSVALENGWEEKLQFDIFLNVVGTDSELIESIGSIDIAAEFQSRGLIYNFIAEV